MNKLDHDFTNAKVGDKVYSVRYGKGVIEKIHPSHEYPLFVGFPDGNGQTYTLDGFFHTYNETPDLYKHPIKVVHADAVVLEEREMMVSDNEKDWFPRVVFIEKNGKYLAWNDAKTIEEAVSRADVFNTRWRYAITKEEYEECFGVKSKAKKRIEELQNEIEKIKKENNL